MSFFNLLLSRIHFTSNQPAACFCFACFVLVEFHGSREKEDNLKLFLFFGLFI